MLNEEIENYYAVINTWKRKFGVSIFEFCRQHSPDRETSEVVSDLVEYCNDFLRQFHANLLENGIILQEPKAEPIDWDEFKMYVDEWKA